VTCARAAITATLTRSSPAFAPPPTVLTLARSPSEKPFFFLEIEEKKISNHGASARALAL
jgi:hypothetical protein